MSDSDRSRKAWRNESLLSLGGNFEEDAPPREEDAPPREQESFFGDATPRSDSARSGEHSAGKDASSPIERTKRRLFPERSEAPPRVARREAQEPAYPPAEHARQSRNQGYTQTAGGDDVYWRPLIDPMRIISAILRSKRLILLTTALGAVAGVLIALSTPKEYYSATEILFDPRDLQILEYDLTSGGLPSDATLALIENQVGIIQSGTVLSGVVERLDLANDPEFNGQGSGILSSLFSFGGEASNATRREAIAVNNLAEKLNVGRNERTFIIHVGVSTQDPDKSALIANTMAEVFLQENGDIQQQTANRANTSLTGRLDELQNEVETAERAVADFKAQNDIVDTQGRLITDDAITRLNDQLSSARARTAELNARVASSRDLDVDRVLGGALPEQVSSPVMTELLGQYARLSQQADRVAANLGPRHPEYQALQSELAGARQAIGNELRRTVASTQVELKRAVQVEQDLAARLARLKVEKGTLEGKQVTLRELERGAEARRSVYEGFLLRARQTGQQQNVNTANISIISKAHPPLLPTGPRRLYIVLAGAIAGFLAGVGIAAARGAYESLRGDMRPEPSAPGRATGRRGFHRRNEDFPPPDGEFDPPPDNPGPGRGRRAYGAAAWAEARPSAPPRNFAAQPSPAARHRGYERPTPAYEPDPYAADPARGYYPEPNRDLYERWGDALHVQEPDGFDDPAPQREFAAPYSSTEEDEWARWESMGDEPAEEEPVPSSTIEALRQNLRALRDDIDALAERRARYG